MEYLEISILNEVLETKMADEGAYQEFWLFDFDP